MSKSKNGKGPRLQCSKNYDLFVHSELNRSAHADPNLWESMKTFGYAPSHPIQVIILPSGKYSIIAGHHRFDFAKALGLPVWFVVDDTCTDLFYLETAKQSWSGYDFVYARANAGNQDCMDLLEFKKDHGFSIATAAALVGGHSGGNSRMKNVRKGDFKIGDMKHANRVAQVSDKCFDLGVPFAREAAFVNAISYVLRIKDLSASSLITKLENHNHIMKKKSTRDEYLSEIEKVYNWKAKRPYRAIVIEARNAVRARSPVKLELVSEDGESKGFIGSKHG